jgi:hypothetical protein
MLLSALPTSAAAPMRFSSPHVITSGMPVSVASITPCPAPPTTGSVIVQVSLSFPSGGSGQVLSTASDGSWSGSITFNFAGVPSRGTISATCDVFNGTGVPYAQYKDYGVKLVS